MSRENDIDALIEHLTAAMNHALKLKVRDIFYLINMAALATLDISAERPDDDAPFPSRDLH
jgi:hypothetical protein